MFYNYVIEQLFESANLLHFSDTHKFSSISNKKMFYLIVYKTTKTYIITPPQLQQYVDVGHNQLFQNLQI